MNETTPVSAGLGPVHGMAPRRARAGGEPGEACPENALTGLMAMGLGLGLGLEFQAQLDAQLRVQPETEPETELGGSGYLGAQLAAQLQTRPEADQWMVSAAALSVPSTPHNDGASEPDGPAYPVTGMTLDLAGAAQARPAAPPGAEDDMRQPDEVTSEAHVHISMPEARRVYPESLVDRGPHPERKLHQGVRPGATPPVETHGTVKAASVANGGITVTGQATPKGARFSGTNGPGSDEPGTVRDAPQLQPAVLLKRAEATDQPQTQHPALHPVQQPGLVQDAPAKVGGFPGRHDLAAIGDVDADEVLAQVMSRVRVTGSGSGEKALEVHLRPEHLGRIVLRVSGLPGGPVTAILRADRPEIAGLLRDRLGELTQALSQQGIRVGDIEVSTLLTQAGGQQYGSAANNPGQSQSWRRYEGTPQAGIDRAVTRAAESSAVHGWADRLRPGYGPGHLNVVA